MEDDIDMEFDPPGSAMGSDANTAFGSAHSYDQNGDAQRAGNNLQGPSGQAAELYSPSLSAQPSGLSDLGFQGEADRCKDRFIRLPPNCDHRSFAMKDFMALACQHKTTLLCEYWVHRVDDLTHVIPCGSIMVLAYGEPWLAKQYRFKCGMPKLLLLALSSLACCRLLKQNMQ